MSGLIARASEATASLTQARKITPSPLRRHPRPIGPSRYHAETVSRKARSQTIATTAVMQSEHQVLNVAGGGLHDLGADLSVGRVDCRDGTTARENEAHPAYWAPFVL